MRIDPLLYQKTITAEIKALQNRVRYLIADGNWAEEGRYKEAILKRVLTKQLPSQLSVGTGFVVKEEHNELIRSKQIDIIIYDNTCPVLFKEGDFIITTPLNVCGIIEVKSQLPNESTKLMEIFYNAMLNGQVVGRKIFNGIFSFNQGNFRITREGLMETIKESLLLTKGIVNHISLGENYFIKFWETGNPQSRSTKPCYSLYKLEAMSFSYFISNLVEKVTDYYFDKEWFLYPIEGGKEQFHITDIHLEE